MLRNRYITEVIFIPTNKAPCGFYMEHEYLEKMKFITKKDTRSLSNLLEHLCKLHIGQYEEKHGEIDLSHILLKKPKNKGNLK